MCRSPEANHDADHIFYIGVWHARLEKVAHAVDEYRAGLDH
jgi:hypothetical protein